MKQKFKKPTKVKQQSAYQTNSALSMESLNISPVGNEKLVVVTDISTEDLKAKLDSMIDRIDDGEYKWKFIVCLNAFKRRNRSITHVEIHIEGLSYPCNHCGKVSRSSSALAVHISTFHKR